MEAKAEGLGGIGLIFLVFILLIFGCFCFFI
ncbi:MAG: hypothetical protein A4E54_01245 [Pelotomaculum sp. PtaB.Bin117]|nr:MAG: hypothetical protein A4E54_01245 [Pelotomaculum sp. PtaB.Bin117]OPY63578.1 MAG: hypothetical protein A4E56_00457 [Pelotomaculum sp. PtaU1.Bin065]